MQISSSFSQQNKTEWSGALIADTLSIYRPEFISVTSAHSFNNVTIADVRVPLYPFTHPGHIDYITASMASLIVAQMGYLHIRHLILAKSTPLLADVTDTNFKSSRDAGNIVFRKEVLKYNLKLPSHEEHECVITSSHIHRSRHCRIGAYSIDIGKGAMTGEGIIALFLAEV